MTLQANENELIIISEQEYLLVLPVIQKTESARLRFRERFERKLREWLVVQRYVANIESREDGEYCFRIIIPSDKRYPDFGEEIKSAALQILEGLKKEGMK